MSLDMKGKGTEVKWNSKNCKLLVLLRFLIKILKELQRRSSLTGFVLAIRTSREDQAILLLLEYAPSTPSCLYREKKD
jgi:hypothetical protein